MTRSMASASACGVPPTSGRAKSSLVLTFLAVRWYAIQSGLPLYSEPNFSFHCKQTWGGALAALSQPTTFKEKNQNEKPEKHFAASCSGSVIGSEWIRTSYAEFHHSFCGGERHYRCHQCG